ncbi:MAG: hypothetical protein GXP04_08220 [Alphaproteobacteria bacterium]|nr:hypothetical protein [Alphaproteobacteria bacterium]
MQHKLAVDIVSSLFDDSETKIPLGLCVLDRMQDEEFFALLSTLVETNPKHWSKIHEFIEGALD